MRNLALTTMYLFPIGLLMGMTHCGSTNSGSTSGKGGARTAESAGDPQSTKGGSAGDATAAAGGSGDEGEGGAGGSAQGKGGGAGDTRGKGGGAGVIQGTGGGAGATQGKGGASSSEAGAAGTKSSDAGTSTEAGPTTPPPPNPNCNKSKATWTNATDPLWAMQDFPPSYLRENFWNNKASGAGQLSLWAVDSRCWGVDANSSDAVNPGTVKSYPDMARGWVVGEAGFKPANSGMPIQVKDLKKAKIHWTMNVTGSPLRYYALWDIYFHDTANPGKGTATVNLMIKQRVVDPSGYEQDTESAGADAVTNTFSGITFRENTNTGLRSGSRAIVELFATPVNGDDMGVDDMTLDLKEVIDHYVEKGGSILSTDYLTSIQAGWEILAGGTFVTTDFWTVLQDETEPTN